MSIVLSAAVFARETGSQYDLKSRRLGIPVATVGIIGYLVGTSLGNPLLHAASIIAFYWGSVLYLAGTRSFVATLPPGLLVISLAFPYVYGAAGLVYLDGFSWALLVASIALLGIRRKGPAPPACAFCANFAEKGRSFCSSCGRYLAPVAAPSPRKIVGFAIFTIATLALLSITVPLLVATPTVSLENYGIGGPQVPNQFAPLSGWGTRSTTLIVNGTQVEEYTLTRGTITIQALVSISGDPNSAARALNLTRVGAIPDSSFPPSISQSMSGYTLTVGRTKYVGLDGVFLAQLLNRSTLSRVFLAIDLRQTTTSFGTDHGLSLYATAQNVISWAGGSANWSSVAGTLLSTYQLFSQTATAVSFGGIGVILFTVARDDELAKSRRKESMYSLGSSEEAVLQAFGHGSGTKKGELLLGSGWRANPWISDSAFFSSLDELARRGLVSPSVTIERARPTLYWRRLV